MQDGRLRRVDGATFPALPRSSTGKRASSLAQALVDGDERAFTILIEQEAARVLRACYRVLGRVDEAEDATQEAFVLAYRALSSYRGDGHPAAWLMRIATREAWRRASISSRRSKATTPIDDQIQARLPSEAPGLERAVIDLQDRELVRRAVNDLPEPYREVITLRYFADLSIRDVAVATGRPEGTVKAQIHRGLARLRARVEGTRS